MQCEGLGFVGDPTVQGAQRILHGVPQFPGRNQAWDEDHKSRPFLGSTVMAIHMKQSQHQLDVLKDLRVKGLKADAGWSTRHSQSHRQTSSLIAKGTNGTQLGMQRGTRPVTKTVGTAPPVDSPCGHPQWAHPAH